MTEHRCVDGKWRSGRSRDCEACAANRKPMTVKRLSES